MVCFPTYAHCTFFNKDLVIIDICPFFDHQASEPLCQVSSVHPSRYALYSSSPAVCAGSLAIWTVSTHSYPSSLSLGSANQESWQEIRMR